MILQLTNPQRGFDVLTQVENTVAGKPDEIHQVSTMIDNPWYVHALRIDDYTCYRLSESRHGRRSVSPHFVGVGETLGLSNVLPPPPDTLDIAYSRQVPEFQPVSE
jgi:hypothetical protein